MPYGEIVIRLKNGGDNVTPSGGHRRNVLEESIIEKQANTIPEAVKFMASPVNYVGKQIISDNEEIFNMFIYKKLANFAISTVNQGVSFALNNAGRWSGDIVAQHNSQKVQLAIKTAGYAGNAISSAATGFVVTGGNMVGAAAGALVSSVGMGIDIFNNLYSFGNTLASDNRSVLFNKQRVGTQMNSWSR